MGEYEKKFEGKLNFKKMKKHKDFSNFKKNNKIMHF